MALHTVPTKQLAPEVMVETEDLDLLGAGAAVIGKIPFSDGAGGTSFGDLQDGSSGAATAGQALTADGTGGSLFAAPPPATHASTHADAGADELPADSLAESSSPGDDVSQALRPDGSGGVAWADVDHSEVTGVGIDDHHARDHSLAGAEHSTDTIANLDAKVSDATLVAEIENTTATVDATLTTIATIAIPDDTVVLLEVRVIARQTNAAGRAIYIRRAAVFREAAGVATLEGAVDTPFTRESAGDTAWDATIAVSGNDALIQVTGQGSDDINWKSLHRTRQVA